jgi:F-type H+-transporting ATPase subunit delta
MNESRISVRYSRAVFESALEKNILDDINSDMKLILEVCRIPEFNELLVSPIILPSKKIRLIHSVLGNNLNSLTFSFLDLVVRNGREKYIPAIARVFMHDTMEYKGITECYLTSAVKVEPKILNDVTKLISDIFRTKVDLKDTIDEELIGGFVLRVADNYIDASVKNKLRKIKKGLSTGYENRVL